MNILMYDMSSFIQRDLIYYLERAGHHCRNIRYKFEDKYTDAFFEKKFTGYLKEETYDFVMSTNFYPLIARLCYENNMKYLAWVYDSPIDSSDIRYFQYSTSYIFLFDRSEAQKLDMAGGVHIYHLPLAVNTNRLDRIRPTAQNRKYYDADIAFVGNFYENALQTIRSVQTERDKGYLDALVQTQLQIYGVNFLDSLIDSELTDRINTRLAPYTDVQLNEKSILNTIEKQITYIERTSLCNLLGQEHTLKYYSGRDMSDSIPHITWMGTAHYFSEMPLIFKCSRLNLNITLKGIRSGIPLRALDILGSNATLFSNYQPELMDYFIDGEDIILYESLEDAIAKVDYYLQHEDLRLQLTRSGYAKAKEFFSYPDRITTMLKTAGLL
ncbi:MAG: glycosyltransferase [Lachnospiraceae bacterium]|nr:glycosyltransferase [Lachnospiraceae bacterium]